MEEFEEKSLILIAEDDEILNDYVANYLRKSGYEVVQAFSGQSAYATLSKYYFDLIILDLNLGDVDGMEILHFVRGQSKFLPIMIISSSKDDSVKIRGFKEGCDDYITKPFFKEELLLRIKRMISRFTYMNFEKKKIMKSYSLGLFTIDTSTKTVTKNNNLIPMRKNLFDLMLYFMQNPNTVLSQKTIYQNVWECENIPDENQIKTNLYVNIHALRNLIEDDPKNAKHIVSVNKSGYVFIPNYTNN